MIMNLLKRLIALPYKRYKIKFILKSGKVVYLWVFSLTFEKINGRITKLNWTACYTNPHLINIDEIIWLETVRAKVGFFEWKDKK